MAFTKEELKTALNAQTVGGNLVVGERDKRVFVGKVDPDGMFEITPEGKEMMEQLRNPSKQKKKAKTEEVQAE